MNRINNKEMNTYELMDYLKLAIRQYKHDAMSYEQFKALEEDIDYATERLESESKLLVLPFKLQLCKW